MLFLALLLVLVGSWLFQTPRLIQFFWIKEKLIKQVEVVNSFRLIFFKLEKKKIFFDLPSYAKHKLTKEHIIIDKHYNIDTYTNPDLYPSYRRSVHTGEPLKQLLCTISIDQK